jgi:AbrB family looped-hinge helix DNA binding protein
MIIDHKWVRRITMATTTISPKFQIVIPKKVREKLHLTPQQRLQVIEKGGVITLVPEVPLKSLKGILKGMSKSNIREKKDRM